MSYPQGWRTFCNWKTENPDLPLPPKLNLSKLNRFAARFRLAQSYQGLSLKDYPEPSVDAYSSIFGVFLAYTALEQLYEAVGEPGKVIVEEWRIDEPKIARNLRRSTRILTFLQDKVNKYLSPRIDTFRQGDDHNVLVIAQAVRHLVAHGTMTIHGGGVKPQTTMNFCNLLTKCVNDKTQTCFTECVLSFIITCNNPPQVHQPHR